MTKSMREPVLLARIAMARAQVRVENTPVTPADFTEFVNSVFTELPGNDATALHARHRFSMRKLTLIKDYLAGLDGSDLSSFLERNVAIEGLEHLEAAKTRGAPVIFITPHYGNFPAGCLALMKALGCEKTVNDLYSGPSTISPALGSADSFKGRGYGFNTSFSNDTDFGTLRPLRPGEILTAMPDVFDTSGDVIYVPFLGRLIPVKAGVALLALKSDATIIVGHNCPGDGLRSTLKLRALLDFECTGNLDDDVADLTAAVFREFEDPIRQAPEHWISLDGIVELIGGLLPLGQGDASAWLDILDASKAQTEAVLPGWGDTLREIRTMHREQGKKSGYTGLSNKSPPKTSVT